jgi:hypothetical protein
MSDGRRGTGSWLLPPHLVHGHHGLGRRASHPALSASFKILVSPGRLTTLDGWEQGRSSWGTLACLPSDLLEATVGGIGRARRSVSLRKRSIAEHFMGGYSRCQVQTQE